MTTIPLHLTDQNHFTGKYYSVMTTTRISERFKVALEVEGTMNIQPVVIVLPEGTQMVLLGKDHYLTQKALDSLRGSPEQNRRKYATLQGLQARC